MKKNRAGRVGFTLVELLVVIAIIGILIAMLIPAVQAAREAARATTCKSNLKQLALSVLAHHEARNCCPIGRFGMCGPERGGPDVPSWGWMADILPYAEQQTLHDRGDVPRVTHRQSGVVGEVVGLFLCPTDPYSHRGPSRNVPAFRADLPLGYTNYHAITGANWGADQSRNMTSTGTDWPNPGTNGSADGFENGDGMMFRSDYRRPRRLSDVKDGTSHTFVIGETLPEVNARAAWPYANSSYATCAIPPNVARARGAQYSPEDHDNVAGLHSRHPTGLHIALADGSVSFVANEVDLEVYRAMATIAGGEVFDAGSTSH
ncbi:MAG: DUF1559 domain-containing protein [Planctomycetia bacterium]|nr:DUF1559 domain-containing protein [Planctomycetia bacterium]